MSEQSTQHADADAECPQQIDRMYLELEKSIFSPLVLRGGCGVGGICDVSWICIDGRGRTADHTLVVPVR